MHFPRSKRACVGRGVTLALLIAMMMLGATACGRTSSAAAGGDVQLELKPVTEKVVGSATIEVVLRNAQGRPIDGAEVSVRGDMNHAGMKPVNATSSSIGDGRYLTEDFRFTMGGDWILTALVTLPGGEKIERAFDVKGVASR